jgi:predicted GIY-YIG superfamily endonuclease
MFYTYVLVNRRTARLDTGFSRNLKQRVGSHQKRDPAWTLAYYEAYASEADAGQRERDLKQYGSAWGHLKKRIQRSLGLREAGEALN